MGQENNQLLLTRISYYRWPIGIVLVFIALAAFNVVLATLAFRHNPAKVDESPYEKGMVYQQVIDQIELAAKLGLTAQITTGKLDASGTRMINVALESRRPDLKIHSLKARIYYPQTSEFDLTLKLTQTSPYFFEQLVPLPQNGLCFVDLSLVTDQGLAFIKERIWID